MVQVKSDLPLAVDGEPDNTYWAVGLTADGVAFKKRGYADYRPNPVSADEIINRLNRKERGLLAYENCKVAKLKAFVKARKLKLPKGSSGKKADFIAVLRQADDEPTFSKLFDLPPELRKMIYEQYVGDLQKHLPQLPCQPPLVQTSRLVRGESKPSYDRNSTFLLTFKINAGTSDVVNGHAFLDVTVVPETTRMINVLKDRDVSRIRHITIKLIKPSNRPLGKDVAIGLWTADLNGEGGPNIVQHGRLNEWKGDWYFSVRLEPMNQAIFEVFWEIWQRPGMHKLRRIDVDMLRDVTQIALF